MHIIDASMRARTKIDIPNRSESEFENFDRAVKTILSKKKPGAQKMRKRLKREGEK
jgi:hypothetical protein